MPKRSKTISLKWAKCPIDLTKQALPWLGENGTQTVWASVLGPFAVYPTQARSMPLAKNVRKFTLAHLPSGCLAVCYSNSDVDLQKIAQILLRRCEMAFSLAKGTAIWASLPSDIKQWLESCYCAGGYVDLPIEVSERTAMTELTECRERTEKVE